MSLNRSIKTVAIATVLLTIGGTPGSTQGIPIAKPQADAGDFVEIVRTAISHHDIDVFENHLIDWDGARMRTRRLTLFQVRECFGRPVQSIALEDLPKATPDDPLIPDGYKSNRPVTNLLRIVFDEPDQAPGEMPACVFMLSKDPIASYKIAIILPTTPHAP